MDAPFTAVAIDAGAARATVAPAHALRLCAGHFPDDPLLPGAYLAELMAELAAQLVGGDVPPPEIRRCVFHIRVRPTAEIVVAARRSSPSVVEAEVTVGSTRAAQATLQFRAPA